MVLRTAGAPFGFCGVVAGNGVSPRWCCARWVLLSRDRMSNVADRVCVYIAYVVTSPQCLRCGELLTEMGGRGGNV